MYLTEQKSNVGRATLFSGDFKGESTFLFLPVSRGYLPSLTGDPICQLSKPVMMVVFFKSLPMKCVCVFCLPLLRLRTLVITLVSVGSFRKVSLS